MQLWVGIELHGGGAQPDGDQSETQGLRDAGRVAHARRVVGAEGVGELPLEVFKHRELLAFLFHRFLLKNTGW
ncbi:hypothetical protein [Hymenobacter sp. BT188]|uniref:hypothetical protein n=1 Tax=Hymenobacter sp. BT188 TaxID=2763504 RepID=UPI0029059F0B|nr:hypothetical protein [Hymenobacter sp. BT188]